MNMPLRIYVEDVDLYGMVYHANYLKYFERARTEYLREQGQNLDDLAKAGYLFAIRHVALDFKKPLRFNQQAVVVTDIAKRKPTSLEFLQQIFLKEDVNFELPCCTAQIKVVCINQDMQPQALPAQFLEF